MAIPSKRGFKMVSRYTAICKIKSGFAFIYMISDSRESALHEANKVISRQSEKVSFVVVLNGFNESYLETDPVWS
ncbi:hypothetical protein B5864_17985 [Salmonella enterica]|uniref:hypothetical protein n=1 Tax=Salmonella enterica TaxID=28901 RepID=UPI000408BA09|nr:hypothetical protein [Salmonella enterica]ECJ2402529.1 hypothetical protein [Salmonella enterica subsp. diarizonae]EEM3070982.1 hypothetical protein [Salmonella enterica subsp. enterica serovar Java]EKO1024850.1 hypothetical protein [Salmonella enterica subsp. enterica]EAT5390140.1 hypothetical protein [Salmonella enterica]EBB5477352.1 hypothetical protein [Salmonella enterica]